MKPLQTDKIKFFQQRGPGEKITATFDFLRENRSAWLKSCAWPIIPIALIYGWMQANAITFSPTYDSSPFDFDLMELIVGVTLKKKSSRVRLFAVVSCGTLGAFHRNKRYDTFV